MAEIVDVHGLDLVLGPAEKPGPGRVGAEEIPAESRNAEQVLGHVPDAVALARALFEDAGGVHQQVLLADETADEIEHEGAGGRRPAETRRVPADGVSAAADRRQRIAHQHCAERDRQPQKQFAPPKAGAEDQKDCAGEQADGEVGQYFVDARPPGAADQRRQLVGGLRGDAPDAGADAQGQHDRGETDAPFVGA